MADWALKVEQNVVSYFKKFLKKEKNPIQKRRFLKVKERIVKEGKSKKVYVSKPSPTLISCIVLNAS